MGEQVHAADMDFREKWTMKAVFFCCRKCGGSSTQCLRIRSRNVWRASGQSFCACLSRLEKENWPDRIHEHAIVGGMVKVKKKEYGNARELLEEVFFCAQCKLWE